MMGHLYKEALNHLPKAAIRVIFTDNNLDITTYEPYHLTNLKQIINRAPRELLKILYYTVS
jgi:intein-encoded DNA endonuclease-like protein